MGLHQNMNRDKASLKYIMLRLTYPKLFSDELEYEEFCSALESLKRDKEEPFRDLKVRGKYLDAILYCFPSGDCFLQRLIDKRGRVLWDWNNP